MSFPGRIQQALDYNKTFAETFETPEAMTVMRARGKSSGEGTLILTCLDPRCVPEQFFGPQLRAGVMRNAGGRVTSDIIRTILTLRSLGDVKNIVVVHHTDCGVTYLTDEQISREAKDRTPDAAAEIDEIQFQTFTAEDFEEIIKKDVRTLRGVKALAGMNIYGFALQTETGIVKPLDV